MRYCLGLDNGGTSTKAAVFDETGREVAVAGIDTAMLVPKPGFTERDMDEMWEANCEVIRKAIEKAGISGEEIACVAVCGHGKGLYLWGKDNRPVRNGIISTDNRVWRYPIQWKKDGTEEKVFERSCQHILSSQPVSLLAWLKDNEPETLEKTEWIFACKDYVRFRLTGEAFAERVRRGYLLPQISSGKASEDQKRAGKIHPSCGRRGALTHVDADVCGCDEAYKDEH